MATVYIHMGMPKTGTTALQYFLWDNGEALEKCGIVFPHLPYRYNNVGYYRNAHFLVAPGRKANGAEDYSVYGGDYEAGLGELQRLAQQYDKIVLSDEGMWRLSWNRRDFWEKVRADMNSRGLELKIIVYLRRQDLWVQGYWAQKVRESMAAGFDQFFAGIKDKKFLFDYYAYMCRLAEALGKDALVIRVYEREQFEGPEHNLHSDFLQIFGLTLADGFVLKKELYNIRFDNSYLELRRLLNSAGGADAARLVINNSIKQVQIDNPEADNQRFTYFDPQQQREFLAAYEKSNRKLAQEFLGREDGVLFREKLEDLPKLAVSDRELLETTIRVYGGVIETLVEENQKLKQVIRRAEDADGPAGSVRVIEASGEELGELKEQVTTLFRESRKRDREIRELKEQNRELKERLKEVRENVVLYRLKRKARHLLGKENEQ